MNYVIAFTNVRKMKYQLIHDISVTLLYLFMDCRLIICPKKIITLLYVKMPYNGLKY